MFSMYITLINALSQLISSANCSSLKRTVEGEWPENVYTMNLTRSPKWQFISEVAQVYKSTVFRNATYIGHLCLPHNNASLITNIGQPHIIVGTILNVEKHEHANYDVRSIFQCLIWRQKRTFFAMVEQRFIVFFWVKIARGLGRCAFLECWKPYVSLTSLLSDWRKTPLSREKDLNLSVEQWSPMIKDDYWLFL